MRAAVLLVLVATLAAPAVPSAMPRPPPPSDAPLVEEPALPFALPAASRIQVAGTATTTAPAVGFAAAGASARRVLEASFAGSPGTLVVAGVPVASAAYVEIQWPEFGLTLYQAIGVDGTDLHVAWAYCQGASTLLGTYHESAGRHGLLWSGMSGACRPTAPTARAAALPPLDMPYPPLVSGFTIHGPSIQYDGHGPGRIAFDGDERVLLPFEAVDCTQACGGSGWWELHALLHDPDGGRVTFAILYLDAASPGRVALHYAVTLPGLVSEPSRSYAASWDAP